MLLQLLREIPPITRLMALSTLLLSYATYAHIVSPSTLYLNYQLTFLESFQPWRLLTSVLYFGDLTLQNIVRCFILYSLSSELEKHAYRGVANYGYYIFLNFLTVVLVGLWFQDHSIAGYFEEAIWYVWCRINSGRLLICNTILYSVFFLIPVPAQYALWANLAIHGIFSIPLRQIIVGSIIGHTFYYLSYVVPKLPHFKGVNVLATPKFLQLRVQDF